MNPVLRVIVRVVTACAVLVGLASMHGVGPATGTGCAGGTPSMVTSTMLSAVDGGHDAVVGAIPGSAPLAGMPRDGHGSVCDSTPPRGKATERPAQAASELVGPNLLGHDSPSVRRLGAAIPRAGPALLVSLGVSRT